MAFGLSAGAALAVGVGGSALLGGIAGSKKQGGGTTNSTSNPWEPQQQYLVDGFSGAQSAYDDATAMGTYSGQRVAGLNPYQTQGADFTGGFAGQFGQPFAQNLTGSANNMVSQGSGFGQNANSIYGQYAGVDPTQQILANAGQYANSPYADGMIDSANRDVTRGLYEQQLPTLARGLSGTGNTNSTRGGVESAIMQRGAADRMADTASNIRGSLFNTGLQQSQNQYNQNLTNQLAANQGLLQSYQTGGNSGILGQQAAGNVFDQSQAAGGLYQGQNQAELGAAQQQFAEQQNGQLDLTNKYMQAVGGSYGGTSSTTAPTTGGGLGGFLTGALGGGLSAFGIAGKMGGFGTAASGAGMGANYGISPYGSGYSNTGFR